MILTWYLIGVVIAFILIIGYEFFLDHNYSLKTITKKEWLQDTVISLFSWLAVVLAIIVTIWRIRNKNAY